MRFHMPKDDAAIQTFLDTCGAELEECHQTARLRQAVYMLAYHDLTAKQRRRIASNVGIQYRNEY